MSPVPHYPGSKLPSFPFGEGFVTKFHCLGTAEVSLHFVVVNKSKIPTNFNLFSYCQGMVGNSAFKTMCFTCFIHFLFHLLKFIYFAGNKKLSF